jgi:hypothetical protein
MNIRRALGDCKCPGAQFAHRAEKFAGGGIRPSVALGDLAMLERSAESASQLVEQR